MVSQRKDETHEEFLIRHRKYMEKWRKEHKKEHNEYMKKKVAEWRKNNEIKYVKYRREYKRNPINRKIANQAMKNYNKTQKGRETHEKAKTIRCKFYTPPQCFLNRYYDGAVGHHIDAHNLVWIPGLIHRAFMPHSPKRRVLGTESPQEAKNLDILNSIAYAEEYYGAKNDRL